MEVIFNLNQAPSPAKLLLNPQTHLLIQTASPIGFDGLREAVSMRGGPLPSMGDLEPKMNLFSFTWLNDQPAGVRGDCR